MLEKWENHFIFTSTRHHDHFFFAWTQTWVEKRNVSRFVCWLNEAKLRVNKHFIWILFWNKTPFKWKSNKMWTLSSINNLMQNILPSHHSSCGLWNVAINLTQTLLHFFEFLKHLRKTSTFVSNFFRKIFSEFQN